MSFSSSSSLRQVAIRSRHSAWARRISAPVWGGSVAAAACAETVPCAVAAACFGAGMVDVAGICSAEGRCASVLSVSRRVRGPAGVVSVPWPTALRAGAGAAEAMETADGVRGGESGGLDDTGRPGEVGRRAAFDPDLEECRVMRVGVVPSGPVTEMHEKKRETVATYPVLKAYDSPVMNKRNGSRRWHEPVRA